MFGAISESEMRRRTENVGLSVQSVRLEGGDVTRAFMRDAGEYARGTIVNDRPAKRAFTLGLCAALIEYAALVIAPIRLRHGRIVEQARLARGRGHKYRQRAR